MEQVTYTITYQETVQQNSVKCDSLIDNFTIQREERLLAKDKTGSV